MKHGVQRGFSTAWTLAVWVCVSTGVPTARASQRGDVDADRDVDLADYAGFLLCFRYPTVSVPPPPLDCTVFDFTSDGKVDLADLTGFLGCSGADIGACNTFGGPGVIPAKVTDSAVILGYVFEAGSDPKKPLAGVEVTAVYYPAEGDGPPLKCGKDFCKAFSDTEGAFRFRTPPVQGSETFLLKIRKPEFAENLRQVSVIAGRCWRIDDAFLNRVNPPVLVEKTKGATLTEPTGKVTLVIPPNALMQNSTIGVTPLGSVDAIRDKPPPLVAPAGTFVDVTGVSGEATVPGTAVTMRVPNQYNLQEGTKVRFGKIDHNTLQWMDLCNAFDPNKPCDQNSNLGVGIVKPDGAGGTCIEVQFDHFCTVCTGYCLPYPTPAEGDQSGGSESGDKNRGGCCGPGSVCGSSSVQQREGHLSESVALPGFHEMGRSWAVGLAYSSAAASSTITLSASVNYNSTRPVEGTIFDFAIEGVKLEAVYDRSQNNQKPIGTFFWNGRNGLGDLMPTGGYPYSIVATSLNANAPVAISSVFGGSAIQTFGTTYPGVTPLRSNELKGRAVLVNLRNSPYGAGWSVLNEHRLEFDPDGCIILVLGNADWRLFVPDPTDPNLFDSPAGEFSTLRREAGGTYTREFTDGTKHFFTGLGRIDRIVDRYGYVTQFSYENGELTGVASPTGYFYTLQYSGGKLSRIADSAGRESFFQVNAAGDLMAATDPTGATRTFEYDPDHLLIAQIGSRGERSEYTYENGRVVETKSSDNDGTTLLRARRFEPSALNGELSAAIANGEGTIDNPIPIVSDRLDKYIDGREFTSLNESDPNGQTIRSQDPLNRVTRYEYDANRLLTKRTAPNSAETKYEYDAAGYVTKITEVGDPNDSDDDGVTTFEYNGPFHQVSRLVDPEGKATTIEYYPNGNLSCIEDALHNRTCFFYDDARFPDLVTRIVDALNNTTTMMYDAHGHVVSVTDPLIQTTRAESNDPAGNLTAVIDPRPSAPTTRMSYDAWNRVSQITDAIGGMTRFDYEQGICACSTANLTGVTMPNNTTIAYDYDGLDRMVKMTDQLGHFSTYLYDPEGNRTSWTNRNGEVVTYDYDAAGQLTRKDVPGTGVTTYRYDPLGNLLGATNPASSLGFLYDLRSRMIQATQSFASTPDDPIPFTYAIDYQYDRAGNRTRMQTPDVTIQYVYDALHRLETLTETSPNDPQPFAWTFSYDELSRRKRLDVPNGTYTLYEYDAASQVTSILHKNAQNQTFSGVVYDDPADRNDGYDAAANSVKQTWIQSAGSFDLAYSYDKLSRLVTSTPPPAPDATFIPCAYQYDEANRLLSDCEFTYTLDDEGRQVAKRSLDHPLAMKFIYDAEGRLREIRQEYGDPVSQRVMTAAYDYDPLGRRIEKNVNGVATRFLYDREDILDTMDGANAQMQRYTHGPGIDEPLAVYNDRASGRLFYHADRLGSIIAMSVGTGAIAETRDYDAFGSLDFESSSSPTQPYSYTGREPDLESGVYYYRARQYDAGTGRFLSEDPLGGRGNKYAYVENNPVKWSDPFGMELMPTGSWPPGLEPPVEGGGAIIDAINRGLLDLGKLRRDPYSPSRKRPKPKVVGFCKALNDAISAMEDDLWMGSCPSDQLTRSTRGELVRLYYLRSRYKCREALHPPDPPLAPPSEYPDYHVPGIGRG